MLSKLEVRLVRTDCNATCLFVGREFTVATRWLHHSLTLNSVEPWARIKKEREVQTSNGERGTFCNKPNITSPPPLSVASCPL